MVPWHKGILQRRHKHVSLQPPHEQFFSRLVIVAIPSDHVWQYQCVAVQVHREQSGDQCCQAVSEAPVRVFVDHTDEDWKVLGSGREL